MKELVIVGLKKALNTLDIQVDAVKLEYPENPEHGDFSSNAAMMYAKKLGMAPKALAEKIAASFKSDMPDEVQSVDIAGPGFINFTLKDKVFVDAAVGASEKGAMYGHSDTEKGRKVMVEYTQPNPFKQFHIGHLMNNAIGESVSRLIEWNGSEVKRATYHGDVGLHVAKTIWALMKSGSAVDILGMGAAYAQGTAAYDTDAAAKEEIIEINKKIYEHGDAAVNAVYDAGKKASLDYFESMYARLGSSFDFHFYESEAGIIGKDIVLAFLKKSVFEESEGAVVFKGEQYGLHTRVFLNKEKLPTYEAKEIGLVEMKRSAFAFDQSITITANEQDAFFKVVECAIGKVFPDLAGELMHVSHGILRLTSGKMSSRTGNIISAESLIDDIRALVQEKMAGRGLEAVEQDEITDSIAIGAIKYTILRQGIGGDVIFDSGASISFEGDSGPYLQYSAVRAGSILEKAKLEGVTYSSSNMVKPDKVGMLEKLISRFPDIIERARNEYSPQHVAGYLIDLAGAFNSFYASQQIVDKNDALSPYYLALTQSFLTTMTNGLCVLGIKVPRKM